MDDKKFRIWFEKEQKKLSNTAKHKGKRKYLHFDNRVSQLDEARTRQLLMSERVAQHSFYPFIRFDIREERYRRRKNHAPGDRRREKIIKTRPIDYASHKDALVFSWYATQLSELYEKEILRRGIQDHVIAYRAIKGVDGRGKTNVHFAKEAFEFIVADQPCHVITLDVSKFFEGIDHGLLKDQWARLLGVSLLPEDHLSVFKAITNYRFVRAGRMRALYARAYRKRMARICLPAEFEEFIIRRNLQERGKSSKGIPQGAPVSCVLANMYMINFDTTVAKYVVRERGGFFQRYSDDILIVCKPEHAKEVMTFIKAEIDKLKLIIQEAKTDQHLFLTNEGATKCLDMKGVASRLQYLGLETDGERALIRHSSIAKSQRRRNRGVKRALAFSKAKGKKPPKNFLHTKYAVPSNNFLAYTKRASGILPNNIVPQQVSPLREARQLKKMLEDAD